MLGSNTLLSPKGGFTRPARRFALQLAVVVPLVHAHLILFGYNRTLVRLRIFVPAHPDQTDPHADIEGFALGMRRLVRRIRDHSPWPGSCLSRSLALWWLLRRQGTNPTIHVGTRKFDGRFQAHAWVSLNSRPLNAGTHVWDKYVQFRHNFSHNTPLIKTRWKNSCNSDNLRRAQDGTNEQ